MTKYWQITDISLIQDTISIYRKIQYLTCRYDTVTDIIFISIIMYFCIVCILLCAANGVINDDDDDDDIDIDDISTIF